MKYTKVAALLRLRDKSLSNFADYIGVSRQQIANKKKKDTFAVDEFIKLADFTDTTLCFIDNKSGDILMKFDKKEDLSNNHTK